MLYANLLKAHHRIKTSNHHMNKDLTVYIYKTNVPFTCIPHRIYRAYTCDIIKVLKALHVCVCVSKLHNMHTNII